MIPNLLEMIHYHEHQIASRSLSKKLELNQSIVLYAMDEGESISKETSPRDKLIMILEGQLQLSYADNKQLLEKEALIKVEANTLHHLEALKPCKFLQIEV